MKRFLSLALGPLAVLVGGLALLPLLAWSSLRDLRLEGTDYRRAVLATLSTSRAACTTLAGVAAFVLQAGEVVPISRWLDR